jgi:hypothetical protein
VNEVWIITRETRTIRGGVAFSRVPTLEKALSTRGRAEDWINEIIDKHKSNGSFMAEAAFDREYFWMREQLGDGVSVIWRADRMAIDS